jgi:hypothetical protein
VGLALSLSFASAADEPKTAVVEPGERYRAGWLGRLFLGTQWRDLWTTPIQVPVLDLGSFDGGLTPEREGGGLQTKNLRFKSANGHHWVFRGVDKDPRRVLEEDVRESVLAEIAQDLTSTMNPAGAVVVAPLLEAAGVLHATPALYLMPDDPRLGHFRASFANVLGLVETRDEREIPGVDKVLTTFELFARLEERSDEQVDAHNFLRARLMDVLVGDWDRHVDQWRWVRFKEEGRRIWRPVPRDRDNAFARFTGLLPSISEYYTKQVATFEKDYPSIEKLTFAARYSDRRFLVGLQKEDWDAVTAGLKAKLTDGVIEDAVRRLPPEMYAKTGAALTQALKERRDQLRRASDQFYRVLAHKVDVRGTEGADDAEVLRKPDGAVELSVYPRDEQTGQRAGAAFFHRNFRADETDEVRLYLLGGADRVKIEGDPNGRILLRIITRGDKTEVLDQSGCGRCNDVRRDETKVPEDQMVRFETVRDWGQDLLFFPRLAYDSTRGLVPGAIATLTSYGFALDPYANQTSFGAAYSTGTSQPRIDLTTKFRTRSPTSILGFGRYSGMDQVFFFGLGNQTPRDPALVASGAYRALQKKLILHPLIDFELAGPLHARVGALFESVSAVDPTSVAGGVSGAGGMSLMAGEAGVNLEAVQGSGIRERGFRASLIGRHYPQILSLPSQFSKLRASASFFEGAHLLTDVLLGLHLAGEKNFGSYPFFEAAFLGGIPGVSGLDPGTGVFTGNLLRGYDLNRFAGDASLVGNVELRIAIGKYNGVLPLRYGLLGLTDVGRVFYAPESSKRWHVGAGGGLWLTILLSVPGYRISTTVNTLVVTSEEGTSFSLTSGFGF